MPCYTAPPPWQGAAQKHAEQAVRILCTICDHIDVQALDPVLLAWLLEHRRIDVWMMEQPYMGDRVDPAELERARLHLAELRAEWRRRHGQPPTVAIPA